MKKILGKKSIVALAIGTAFSFGVSVPSYAVAAGNTGVSVNVSVDKGSIDWTRDSSSTVQAVGIGLPGHGGMAMARVAAVMDAQRNLLGVIKGVQIDSDTLMEELIITSDVVKRNINGLLKGAQVTEEGANPDGSYYVRMEVPLYGASNSVAAAALPEVMKNIQQEPIPKIDERNTPLPPQEIKTVRSNAYTGVIINAKGQGLSPTFSPVIYDINGRAIYGARNIDPDMAITKGMVGYASDAHQAMSGKSRAGSNPLVITAVSVRGGANSVNKVNVVVSVEDGDKILLANENSRFLNDGNVVFVR